MNYRSMVSPAFSIASRSLRQLDTVEPRECQTQSWLRSQLAPRFQLVDLVWKSSSTCYAVNRSESS